MQDPPRPMPFSHTNRNKTHITNRHRKHNHKNENIVAMSNKLCMYGAECTSFGCTFRHPASRRKDCRYGTACTKTGCRFRHPPRHNNYAKGSYCAHLQSASGPVPPTTKNASVYPATANPPTAVPTAMMSAITLSKNRADRSLEAEVQALRAELALHKLVIDVHTGPHRSYKLRNPHHLRNIDYLRRIFTMTGRALLHHYRAWVDGGGDLVAVSGHTRTPDDADAFAVLKHGKHKYKWYASKVKLPPDEFLDHLTQLTTLRNDIIGHQSLANPRKCTCFNIAEAMFSAFKIARETPWVLGNLKSLKSTFEFQFRSKWDTGEVVDLFSLIQKKQVKSEPKTTMSTAKARRITRPCRHKASCINFGCPFLHPESRPKECRYGYECNRSGCSFLHPF